MSSIFINGSKFGLSTTMGAQIEVTGISNAAPPVLSSATQPADDSIVVLGSGWSALDNAVGRTAGATSTGFELKGFDTTDTKRFPAGEGAGYVQVASDFVSLTQIRDVQMSGGEQQFYQYQYVEDENGRQLQKPTFKNAIVLTIPMDYDPKKAWYNALIEADRKGEPVVLRCTLPNGSEILYYGYISFNKVPTGAVNENMQVTATFSMLSDPVRYDA